MKYIIDEREAENTESPQRLAYLLHELIHFVSTSKTRLEICPEESEPLEVRRVDDCEIYVLPIGHGETWLSSKEDNK
jgi:hypothetical protein